jgi:hypothetical protein
MCVNIKGTKLEATLIVLGHFMDDGIEKLAWTTVGRMKIDQKRQG